MADKESYQMAIDLLSCHLGLSEEEAKERLGLAEKKSEQPIIVVPEKYQAQ